MKNLVILTALLISATSFAATPDNSLSPSQTNDSVNRPTLPTKNSPDVEISAFPDPVVSRTSRIEKGHWEIGGAFGVGYSSFSKLVVNAKPSFQYFVFNKLSLGPTLEYDGSKNYQRIGIGPAATYYFWKSREWAAFFGQNLILSKEIISEFNILKFAGMSSLGINYFFSPTVAVGMSLDNTYVITSSKKIAENITSDLQLSLKFYF